jgi:hypothetical protein
MPHTEMGHYTLIKPMVSAFPAFEAIIANTKRYVWYNQSRSTWEVGPRLFHQPCFLRVESRANSPELISSTAPWEILHAGVYIPVPSIQAKCTGYIKPKVTTAAPAPTPSRITGGPTPVPTAADVHRVYNWKKAISQDPLFALDNARVSTESPGDYGSANYEETQAPHATAAGSARSTAQAGAATHVRHSGLHAFAEQNPVLILGVSGVVLMWLFALLVWLFTTASKPSGYSEVGHGTAINMRNIEQYPGAPAW